MAQFEQALEKTLKHEGGYADVPGDRGGETYRGVSRRWHPGWPGWEIVDRIKAEFPASINAAAEAHPALSQHVNDFYRQVFWDKLHLGDPRIPQPVGELAFDMYVNLTGATVGYVQRAANGLGADLIVDGAFGPKTLAGLIEASGSANHLVTILTGLRITHYLQQAENHPSQRKFLRGWLNRCAA